MDMYRSAINVVLANPKTDCEALLAHLEKELRRVQARRIERTGNSIRFSGGLFRLVSNWNLLGPISRGEIVVQPESGKLAYSLSFRQLVVVVSLMVGIAAFFILVSDELRMLLFAVPFIWIWLVGMNYLTALTRFDRFLKRGIRAVGLPGSF
jgi:hypothetical protein